MWIYRIDVPEHTAKAEEEIENRHSKYGMDSIALVFFLDFISSV